MVTYTMEWTHELVLEFIDLLQGEQVLWNNKHKNYKNRNLVSDAWIRVKNSLSVPFTIGEMKKKKNSLLTQYRECKKKVKDSLKSNEIYKPSWFAFNIMNNFLGELYDYKSSLDTEELKIESNFSCESTTDNESHSFIDENTSRSILQDSDSSHNESDLNTSGVRKRRRRMQDLAITKPQMDGAYVFIKERPVKKRNSTEPDECDMYVQLLAQKLKKMDEDDRLSLMNDIDNLAFKYIMESKARNRPQSTSSTHDRISTNSNY